MLGNLVYVIVLGVILSLVHGFRAEDIQETRWLITLGFLMAILFVVMEISCKIAILLDRLDQISPITDEDE